MAPVRRARGRRRHARARPVGIWRVRVGRVSLYLLDTNLEDNPERARDHGHLYGGDAETRLRQEIMLGFGGVRALRALGLGPRSST